MYADPQARNKTHQTTVQLLRENLDRTENVRGLVRALTTLCTYEACRAMAARKMASAQWLQGEGRACVCACVCVSMN